MKVNKSNRKYLLKRFSPRIVKSKQVLSALTATWLSQSLLILQFQVFLHNFSFLFSPTLYLVVTSEALYNVKPCNSVISGSVFSVMFCLLSSNAWRLKHLHISLLTAFRFTYPPTPTIKVFICECSRQNCWCVSLVIRK